MASRPRPLGADRRACGEWTKSESAQNGACAIWLKCGQTRTAMSCEVLNEVRPVVPIGRSCAYRNADVISFARSYSIDVSLLQPRNNMP